MDISFYTVESNLKLDKGYGYAGNGVRNSLERLGHNVSFHNSEADVQLNFCQPPLYSNRPAKYNIGYTPWESSSLPEDWMSGFDSVDEVWTTSQKCKEWYEAAGVTKPLHVFEHGVDPVWTPRKRTPGQTIRFLHVGEPAPRKGGQMAMEAFVAAFKYRSDVSLTIKSNGHSSIRVYADNVRRSRVRSILGLPHEVYQNVSMMDQSLSLDQLISLYHMHDVLVYPSYGEGFGLIPLQALATGMPTICTGEWAPYQEYLGDLSLDSRDCDSPWPDIHPGKMAEPSFDHLVELYRMAYDKFENLSDEFYNQAPDVHSRFNWDRLTSNAFKHLGEK